MNGDSFGQILAKTPGRPKTGDFARATAEITGDSKSGINQKLRRVDELGRDIHRIAGTSLDKGVEMDALIKLPEPERKELIAKAAAGEKVSARPVPPPKPLAADKALEVMAADIIAEAASFNDFKRLWGKMERVVRPGVDLDTATKIVAVGSILNEAMKLGQGPYADAIDDLVQDVYADGYSTSLGDDLFPYA